MCRKNNNSNNNKISYNLFFKLFRATGVELHVACPHWLRTRWDVSAALRQLLRLFAGAGEPLQVFRQDWVMGLENWDATPQQRPSCGSPLLVSAALLLLTTEPNRFLTQKVFAKFCLMQLHILAGFEFCSHGAVNIIHFLCSDRQSPQT